MDITVLGAMELMQKANLAGEEFENLPVKLIREA